MDESDGSDGNASALPRTSSSQLLPSLCDVRTAFVPKLVDPCHEWLMVVVFGSHAWARGMGEHRQPLPGAHGDVDLFIVLADTYMGPVAMESEWNTTKLEACVYRKQAWARLLRQHVIMPLAVMSMPAESPCVLLPPHDKALRLPQPLCLPLLRSATMFENGRTLSKGRHRYKDGDVHVGRKCVVHCIRELEFALQLAVHGRVMDFGVANTFTELQRRQQDLHVDWNTYYSVFKPTVKRLRTRLRQMCAKPSEPHHQFCTDYVDNETVYEDKVHDGECGDVLNE